jgi:predicted PurR-regulated permease PerM
VSGVFSAVFSVLLPILLGAALAYFLNPILKLYEFKVFKKIKNKGVLRGLSILMTYVTLLLILAAFAAILIPSLIESVSTLVANADEHLESTAQLLNGIIYKFTDNPEHANLLNGEKLKDILMKAVNTLMPSNDDAMNIIAGIGVGLKNTFLAFFISLYMLISKERLFAQFRKLSAAILGVKGRKRLYRYIRIVHRNFGGYFSGVLVDALIIMVVSFVCFLIFNIPYAPLIAVIIGTTNIIPIFGPFIGAIPSFIIIFIQNPTKALIFAILILVIQQIDGNIIAPKVLGNSTNISSLGVIIAITVMGDYFGIVGMIIGVPIFAASIAIGKEFIDHRLRIADMPTDTAEYYADDSLVDPHEIHETVSQKMFRKTTEFFKKLLKIKDKFKKGNTAVENAEVQETETNINEINEKEENKQQ